MYGLNVITVTSGALAAKMPLDLSPGAIGWFLFLIITIGGVFFEISPIKINPISWLGSLLFKPVNDKMDSIQGSIDQIISDQDKYRFSTIRWEILSFRNDINNGNLFTVNDYQHIMDNYKEYEALHEIYGFTNGYIEDAMKDITAHYDAHKDLNVKYF